MINWSRFEEGKFVDLTSSSSRAQFMSSSSGSKFCKKFMAFAKCATVWIAEKKSNRSEISAAASTSYAPDVKTSVTARHWWIALSFSEYNDCSRIDSLCSTEWMSLLNVLHTGRMMRMMETFMTGAVARDIQRPCCFHVERARAWEWKCFKTNIRHHHVSALEIINSQPTPRIFRR